MSERWGEGGVVDVISCLDAKKSGIGRDCIIYVT